VSPSGRSRGRSRAAEGGHQAPLRVLGRGLGHAVRVRIVTSLLGAEDELSSVDLADQLDMNLGSIEYHLGYLLALGMIESKRAGNGRGSLQHFYSLVPDVRNLFVAVIEPTQTE
jgi:DNA-binding transcriptional ArsR family regulator